MGSGYLTIGKATHGTEGGATQFSNIDNFSK